MYAHTAWAKLIIHYTALITSGIYDAQFELQILLLTIQWVKTAIRNVILVLYLIVKGKFNILAIRATHGSVHGTTLVIHKIKPDISIVHTIAYSIHAYIHVYSGKLGQVINLANFIECCQIQNPIVD